MFTASSPELPQKSLQIKQDDKFFSRLLSKEKSSNMASPSFRVYYGGVSGSVPFMWESQPGTPKHALSDTSLPPLTPPPSYYSQNPKQPTKKHSRSKLLNTLFLRINLKKPSTRSSPPSSSPSLSSLSWSSSSHSSLSVPVTPSNNFHRRRSQSSCVSSMSSDEKVDEAEVSLGSPQSTLCYGMGRSQWRWATIWWIFSYDHEESLDG
ncbi:hypothetical protein LOK49_LG05G00125 [Camellia lanceoleosa]|uniref:Uncharacterized protein n=1 Tax=Camellia lanceoleosa TaxID=1840588 RepID=A0ACC0HJ54_9ERIC|nr:hypothetical protein LOK49_LG05G00125 [Camellia lanceoleosa]